jgi:hypothetical protein
MQTNDKIVEKVYVPAGNPVMVPAWISLIVLIAVGVYAAVYLIQLP